MEILNLGLERVPVKTFEYLTPDSTVEVQSQALSDLENVGFNQLSLHKANKAISEYLHFFDSNVYPKIKDKVEKFAFKCSVYYDISIGLSIEFCIDEEKCLLK